MIAMAFTELKKGQHNLVTAHHANIVTMLALNITFHFISWVC